MRGRWSFDRAVAVLELAGAAVVVVWLVEPGIEGEAAGTAGRTLLDRAFPFLLALVAGAVLVGWAVRSLRAAARGTDRAPGAEVEPSSTPTTEPRAPDGRGPAPLPPGAERELARIVAVLADAGVFAPAAPVPEQLHGPVADYGEPVTAEGVLTAIAEADHYVPGFDASAYSANLAFHDSHVEQFAGVVRAQVADLVRLAAGGLADVAVDVELRDGEPPDGGVRVPTTVRIVTGGDEQVLAYDGAGSYLSTVVHVALARVLRARGTGRRLAWLWNDQGVWLSGLPDGAVARLDDALRPAAGEGWEWVDEQEPVAAGEGYPPRP